jgi:hypothetical protein
MIQRSEFKILRFGIWIYFILLIFEGALRKWAFPGLATPLLIVRDPVAAWLIFLALRKNILRPNLYLTGGIIISIISFFTAIFLGHGNIWVALFGLRIFLLHFPLIFIIGHVFDRRDVVLLGKVMLWMAIPMTLLIAIQFYSPQSAWINRGTGESEGGGFSGAMGYYRPPATFSFITGTSSFFSLVACYVFYFWLSGEKINRIILIASTIALLAAIPFSISRTLFFAVGLTIVFAAMAIIRKPEYIGKMLLVLIICVTLFLTFGDNASIQTPIEAFTDRFTGANEVEGGLVKGVAGDRFLGGLLNPILGSSDQPFFGHGMGMGTNVGAMLLSGKTTYLIDEGEWGRLIGEQGPLLGLSVIFLRLLFCLQLLKAAYSKLQLADFLPWMILNFALLSIAQGQWGQPSSLGFSVLVGGIMLAAFKYIPHKETVAQTLKETDS